jgi:hypothetical protein
MTRFGLHERAAALGEINDASITKMCDVFQQYEAEYARRERAAVA